MVIDTYQGALANTCVAQKHYFPGHANQITPAISQIRAASSMITTRVVRVTTGVVVVVVVIRQGGLLLQRRRTVAVQTRTARVDLRSLLLLNQQT